MTYDTGFVVKSVGVDEWEEDFGGRRSVAAEPAFVSDYEDDDSDTSLLSLMKNNSERVEQSRRSSELVLSESELATRGAWRPMAACLNLEPDLFFPLRNGIVGPYVSKPDRDRLNVQAGKQEATPYDLCMQCPVRSECVSEAIHSDQVGTWGGLSRLERDMIRAVLSEEDPDRLKPQCGTLDGWFAHLRRGERVVCSDCRESAEDAGVFASTSGVGPLRRALGDNRIAAEVLPDASESVPAKQAMLV